MLGEILRALARTGKRVARKRTLEIEMPVVQQQQLVARGRDDVAGGFGAMTPGTQN